MPVKPYISTLAAILPKFEGSVSWMYADTVGKVTVGDGFLIPDVSSAIALPFQFNGAIAEPGDVRSDWLRVSKMAPGHPAGYYHCDTSPTLPREAMASLLVTKLQEFDAYLCHQFPELESYPESSKAALLDICYNVGPGGLAKFHHMIADVLAGNWKGAAADCHRPQIADERNNWTRDQFLEAEKV